MQNSSVNREKLNFQNKLTHDKHTVILSKQVLLKQIILRSVPFLSIFERRQLKCRKSLFLTKH